MLFKFYFKKPQIKSYLYNPLNGTQNMPTLATDRNLFIFYFESHDWPICNYVKIFVLKYY